MVRNMKTFQIFKLNILIKYLIQYVILFFSINDNALRFVLLAH